jgi:aryl-alcohol dehydrogenase-like predicted oxidoreductase
MSAKAYAKKLKLDRSTPSMSPSRATSELILSLTALAVGWLAAQPLTSTVIIGATRPEQISENAAYADLSLSADEFAALDFLTRR